MDLLAAPFLSSPLPAMVLGGLFVGAAASRATRPAGTRPDPERAAARKWVEFCLCLCLAVISALLAVFLPGPTRILHPASAWAAGGAAMAAFGALRFRRAVGIPVVILAVALAAVLLLFLQSVRAFTGETEIAAVRVLSTEAGSMRLQLVPRGEEPVLLTMKGTSFTPIVRVVIFSDLLVFLGARTWYRFEGMTSFDDALRQQDTDFRFAHPPGISESLWKLFESHETQIPGVKTAQTELVLKRASALATFSVMVENDGGVQIVEKQGAG